MREYDECGTWVRDSGETHPDIEDYMQKLLLHGRKEITVNRYRSVLKMTCRILGELGRTCAVRSPCVTYIYQRSSYQPEGGA